jgi:signal transduction histidine kinase
VRLEKAYYDLERANVRAEESSRMKTNFIQQISHEIRTPLNILSGFTQVITAPDMQLDTATKKDINWQITENTNRITRLVNKMLELSDASSQTVIKRDDTVPAVQIAAEAVDKVGFASDATLAFDFDVRPEVENIMLTTHLNQAVRALTLLLDNGRKFLTAPGKNQNCPSSSDAANRGTVRLRVELTGDTSATTTMVSFVVEDTGIGVPPEEAEHIFDEFVQLNDYYEGTGIGLTVARSIARRLGGDVQLDTAYTEGARFVFTLPA